MPVTLHMTGETVKIFKGGPMHLNSFGSLTILQEQWACIMGCIYGLYAECTCMQTQFESLFLMTSLLASVQSQMENIPNI